MQLEIELKLLINPADIKQFYNLPLLQQHARQSPQQNNVSSIYFDTADFRLRQHKLSLRVRHYGTHCYQTIKNSGERLGNLYTRKEWEVSTSETTPDLNLFDNEIQQEVKNIINTEKLSPIFKTEFQRTCWHLVFNDGAEIELALDCGAIHAGALSEPINEIELELKAGNPGKLEEVAEQLRAVLTLPFENKSKAERGYTLYNAIISRTG